MVNEQRFQTAASGLRAVLEEAESAVQACRMAVKERDQVQVQLHRNVDEMARLRSRILEMEQQIEDLKGALSAHKEKICEQIDLIRGLKAALRSEVAGVMPGV